MKWVGLLSKYINGIYKVGKSGFCVTFNLKCISKKCIQFANKSTGSVKYSLYAMSGILTGKLGVVENMTSLNFKNEYK